KKRSARRRERGTRRAWRPSERTTQIRRRLGRDDPAPEGGARHCREEPNASHGHTQGHHRQRASSPAPGARPHHRQDGADPPPGCPAARANDLGDSLGQGRLAAVTRRWLMCDAEIKAHDADLDALTASCAPIMLEAHEISTGPAAEMLILAGDNPERIRSEAA